MTETQRQTLTKLVSETRARAQKIGPPHASCDDIFEAEKLLGISNEHADGNYAERMIKKLVGKTVLTNQVRDA